MGGDTDDFLLVETVGVVEDFLAASGVLDDALGDLVGVLDDDDEDLTGVLVVGVLTDLIGVFLDTTLGVSVFLGDVVG